MREPLLAVLLMSGLGACAAFAPKSAGITLIDGAQGLDNFSRFGEAAWAAADGAVQSSGGGKDPSYLVSKLVQTSLFVGSGLDDANSIFITAQTAKTTERDR